MATITILGGTIVLDLDVASGSGRITSDVERIRCSVCDDPACNSCWCGSQGQESDEDADDVAARLMHNGAMDGLESLILAHACAGIDIADAKYQTAVQTALDAIANHLA